MEDAHVLLVRTVSIRHGHGEFAGNDAGAAVGDDDDDDEDEDDDDDDDDDDGDVDAGGSHAFG